LRERAGRFHRAKAGVIISDLPQPPRL
jgi:hypothetical protein